MYTLLLSSVQSASNFRDQRRRFRCRFYNNCSDRLATDGNVAMIRLLIAHGANTWAVDRNFDLTATDLIFMFGNSYLII